MGALLAIVSAISTCLLFHFATHTLVSIRDGSLWARVDYEELLACAAISTINLLGSHLEAMCSPVSAGASRLRQTIKDIDPAQEDVRLSVHSANICLEWSGEADGEAMIAFPPAIDSIAQKIGSKQISVSELVGNCCRMP